MPLVRPATSADLPAIRDIVNDVIRTTTAIFSDAEVSLDERHAWMTARSAAGYPVIVAEDAGAIVGFASYGAFRSGPPGYRHAAEHSVHVRADRRGQRIGPTLVGALIEIARERGVLVLVAGIDATAEASIRMHARLGFAVTGRMPGVGFKRGRRLDLVMMQRDV
jgi:L-amino acid N-acyltransferase